jgi:hypothetical protein
MPLLLKKFLPHSALFQVDNTYESSKDVTRREVSVDIMNYSTTSKVKPISHFSGIVIISRRTQIGYLCFMTKF